MSAVPVLGSAGNPGPVNPETKAKTNLIVNYLPQSMSEDDIRNLFGSVGAVQSCKLIKDKLSQMSLGYAFVNYHNDDDADKAIQSLNGLPLQNKTIKVSYARPSSVAIKNANLYVAYMPKNWTQTDLESQFRRFGTIITSKVLVDGGTGLTRGVGFVRFDQHQEAEAAISAMNGKVFQGSAQPLLVKFANQPKTTPGAQQQQSTVPTVATGTVSSIATLAAPSPITGLVTNPSRRAGSYGATVGGPIRHTVPSLRYNPVSAITAGTAAAAAASAASLTSLTAAALPGFTQQGWCIFVYNLPENTQDSLLYQLFCPFGAINSVKVIKDLKSGKCKRYGFVNMVNYEEAYQAIMTLNGYNHEGKTLQVSFKTDRLNELYTN